MHLEMSPKIATTKFSRRYARPYIFITTIHSPNLAQCNQKAQKTRIGITSAIFVLFVDVNELPALRLDNLVKNLIVSY